MQIKYFLSFVLIFFNIIAFTGGLYTYSNDTENDTEQKFSEPCVVLIEANTGTVLYSRNADVKVPVGTMNKLMTVLLVAEQIKNGKLMLDDTVKASTYANTMQGAQIWLMPGEEMSVSDLLKAVIIGNANDASVALAEKVSYTENDFVKLMNSRAKELGMHNTTFTNCNGYRDDSLQVSTAYDMALLSAELSKYDFLTKFFITWLDYVRGKDTELVNSNILVKNYNGIVGFKAGYSESSQNCISAGADRNGALYIVAALNYKDKDTMFSESKATLNMGFQNFQIVTPDIPDEMPENIVVKNGINKNTDILISEQQTIVIPNGTYKNVTYRIILPEYIYAPIAEGDKIGEIQYYLNDKLLFKSDIISTQNVEDVTFMKAIIIILKNMLSF